MTSKEPALGGESGVLIACPRGVPMTHDAREELSEGIRGNVRDNESMR